MNDNREEILYKLEKLLWGKLTAENCMETISCLEELEVLSAKDISVKIQSEKKMLHILKTAPLDDLGVIFLVSIMWRIFLREEYLLLLLEGLLKSEILNVFHLEFMYYQIACVLFKHPECRGDRSDEQLSVLYDKIGKMLLDVSEILPRRKEERNPQRVIVMTSAFLGEKHAPTHSLLERCCLLEKLFKVEVHIVSAKEGIFRNGQLPFYRVTENYSIDSYSEKSEYQFGGCRFSFHQGKIPLDSGEGLKELTDYVVSVNPYYILYIGGQSHVADLLNRFCPVISVATVFSTIPNGRTAFAMVGRSVSQEERKKCKSEIIEVPFTFELTEKKRNYTRRELGLPEDAFVMAVVGNRLDYDVREEFLEAMGRLEHGIFLFIGAFGTYEQWIGKVPWLKDKSVSLGRVEDVAGILECADLYINPRRLGGGFSVIEAFHAGVPAVSIAYGDVAVAAGKEFCVPDYTKMLEVIRRYQTDQSYYEHQVIKAKKREAEITNGEDAFKRGMEQILSSDKFY